MHLILWISRPDKREEIVYFKKSILLKRRKLVGKYQRNRVLNLKLEALDVVELMELMEPVREAVLSETCVIVHRMQLSPKQG